MNDLMRLALIGMILTAGVAHGADQIPAPTAPFVAAPRPNTHWEMRIEYKPDAPPTRSASMSGIAAPAPAGTVHQPTVIACWRDAKQGRIVITWNNADETEGYIADGRVFIKAPNGVAAAQAADGGDMATSAFYARGYPETSWVALDHYRGTETINAKPCYKFHRDAVYGMEVSTPETTAWISVVDKTPVRVLLGNALCNYSAITPWDGPVSLPPDVRAKIQIVSREDRALEALGK